MLHRRLLKKDKGPPQPLIPHTYYHYTHTNKLFQCRFELLYQRSEYCKFVLGQTVLLLIET